MIRGWLRWGALALVVLAAPSMAAADERHDTQDEAKAMVEKAESEGSAWVDYRWVNPVDKKIEQKSSYA